MLIGCARWKIYWQSNHELQTLVKLCQKFINVSSVWIKRQIIDLRNWKPTLETMSFDEFNYFSCLCGF